MNYRSKNRNDFSEGANYRSKIHGESSRDANYRSKNRANQNNRCHENAGKFRRNIVSSEISSKSQEFHRNSFALLLHNTVVKILALWV